MFRALLSAICFLTCCSVEAQGARSGEGSEIVIREGWVLTAERGRPGRIPLPVDVIEWASLQGELQPPDPSSAESTSAEGLSPWRKLEASAEGVFSDRALSRGWLWTYVEVPEDGVWILETRGSGSVRINGQPRVGDIYGNGMVAIPVRLVAGRNSLVFIGARGGVSGRLYRAEKELSLSLRDTTFPQVVRGEREALWGALMLVNAMPQSASDLYIRTSGPGLVSHETPMPWLQETSVRKVGFQIEFAEQEVATSSEPALEGMLPIRIELVRRSVQDGEERIEVLDTQEVQWQVVSPDARQRRTFVSQIDGSVQYYSVVPPLPQAENAASEGQATVRAPAMTLTLHGAGVEGDGQAGVYRAKPDMTMVAPTNRRNFGFDWEDWGRWDALEVLDQAMQRYPTDDRRVYLSGHSMGGHGTWHIGSLYPDRFAAVGPSAGWISFSTYMGGIAPSQDDNPVRTMLSRAAAASDTLARARNLQTQGVYVLHGDRDDNVPVEQARQMRKVLAEFHPDFVYKEQPGAGHWWGNACCDWEPMFQFFGYHQLPESLAVNSIDFTTPNPVVSSRYYWSEILTQQQPGLISRLELARDAEGKKISGTTTNAQRIALTLWLEPKHEGESDASQTWTLDLDGVTREVTVNREQAKVHLEKSGEGWSIIEAPLPDDKYPGRGGNVKEAFRNRFMLVYGTQGTEEENQWMESRAKYDAETFWYRGNGSVDVVSDQEWERVAELDRSVIVYGNADINGAWRVLLEQSPANCNREGCLWGEQRITHRSQVMLMIRPRSGSEIASVGAIGGTDLKAMRSTNRLPLFSSGSGYPDLLVLDADYLVRGADAVRVLGYFGTDWSIEHGDWAVQAMSDEAEVEGTQ